MSIEAAAELRGMIRHREELIAESTQRKNKLTALCDEIFPELTRVLQPYQYLPCYSPMKARSTNLEDMDGFR